MDPQFDRRSPTPAQCRAARAFLGWSLVEASRRAGLSVATTRRAESDDSAEHDADARCAFGNLYETTGVSFVQSEGRQGLTWRREGRPSPA